MLISQPCRSYELISRVELSWTAWQGLSVRRGGEHHWGRGKWEGHDDWSTHSKRYHLQGMPSCCWMEVRQGIWGFREVQGRKVHPGGGATCLCILRIRRWRSLCIIFFHYHLGWSLTPREWQDLELDGWDGTGMNRDLGLRMLLFVSDGSYGHWFDDLSSLYSINAIYTIWLKRYLNASSMLTHHFLESKVEWWSHQIHSLHHSHYSINLSS